MEIAMSDKEFETFKLFIYELTGIQLSSSKRHMLFSRILKRVYTLELNSFSDYFDYIRNNKEELSIFIDKVSTNFTSFFREENHFQFLDEFIQERIKEGQIYFKIWCCACSTGEEPYSIAMYIHRHFPEIFKTTSILATDISERVLEIARAGSYPHSQVKPILPEWEVYFTPSHEHHSYELLPLLKHPIVFKRINLSHTPFPMKGPFHIIFCKNVMIYFSDIIKENLLREIHRLLEDRGKLLLGNSESLINLNTDFQQLRASTYEKS